MGRRGISPRVFDVAVWDLLPRDGGGVKFPETQQLGFPYSLG